MNSGRKLRPTTPLTVFWNTRIGSPDHEGSFLIGWQLGDAAIVVCGASATSAWDSRRLEEHLKKMPHLSSGLPRPTLVGFAANNDSLVAQTANSHTDQLLEPSSHGSTLIFTVLSNKPTLQRPRIAALHVDGKPIDVTSVYVVLFDEPDARRGRFLSLEPMQLDLSRYNVADLQSTASISQLTVDPVELGQGAKFRANIMDLGSSSAELALAAGGVTRMDLAVDLINSSQAVNKHMLASSGRAGDEKDSDEEADETEPTTSSPLRRKTAGSSLPAIGKTLFYPFALFLYAFLITLNFISSILLTILRFPLPLPGDPRLTDLSATCAQVELRVQQAAFWHTQVARLWDTGARELARRHAEYVNFNNTVWLIANDVILGVALGGFLLSHADQAVTWVDSSLGSLASFLRSMSLWLMDWPAGLKLNAPLARFLGELFLWLLTAYDALLELVRPHLVDLVVLLGTSGTLGLTLSLALFSDLLALSTLHVALFYRVAARIHAWQLNAISSLSLLFRGRKYNVLRKRVDAQDYALDQLAVGTILLCVVVFLAPTVLTYYVLFALTRSAVVVVQVAIEAVAAAANHFPLFALTLRIKDGSRLPGGLRVTVEDGGEAGEQPKFPQQMGLSTAYLRLDSVPLPFPQLFFQSSILIGHLLSTYLGPETLTGLARGEPLRSVSKLRYLFLPAGEMEGSRYRRRIARMLGLD